MRGLTLAWARLGDDGDPPPIGSFLRCHMAPYHWARGRDLYVVAVTDSWTFLSPDRNASTVDTYCWFRCGFWECQFEVLWIPDQVRGIV